MSIKKKLSSILSDFLLRVKSPYYDNLIKEEKKLIKNMDEILQNLRHMNKSLLALESEFNTYNSLKNDFDKFPTEFNSEKEMILAKHKLRSLMTYSLFNTQSLNSQWDRVKNLKVKYDSILKSHSFKELEKRGNCSDMVREIKEGVGYLDDKLIQLAQALSDSKGLDQKLAQVKI
jgi:vacuolar-type H+-ATPase subunit I/STV1